MAWSTREYVKLVNVHRVRLRGWPREHPFGNLSTLPQSTQIVRDLQQLWDRKELVWESVPEGEVVTFQSTIPSWTVTEQEERNPGRRDIGGTHYRPVKRARHPRSGAKSAAFVTRAMDSEISEDGCEGEDGSAQTKKARH